MKARRRTSYLTDAQELATRYDLASIMSCADQYQDADNQEMHVHAQRDIENITTIHRLNKLFPRQVWTRHRALVAVKGGYAQSLAKRLYWPTCDNHYALWAHALWPEKAIEQAIAATHAIVITKEQAAASRLLLATSPSPIAYYRKADKDRRALLTSAILAPNVRTLWLNTYGDGYIEWTITNSKPPYDEDSKPQGASGSLAYTGEHSRLGAQTWLLRATGSTDYIKYDSRQAALTQLATSPTCAIKIGHTTSNPPAGHNDHWTDVTLQQLADTTDLVNLATKAHTK